MPFPTSTNPGLGGQPQIPRQRMNTSAFGDSPMFGPSRQRQPIQPPSGQTPPYSPNIPQRQPTAPAPYNPKPPVPFRPGGGVPSPLSGNAVRQGARPVPQAPPPPVYNPGLPAGPRTRTMGNTAPGPGVETYWTTQQENNFNTLSGIDPSLIWAHQYNIEKNLNQPTDEQSAAGINPENYGWEAAQQVRSILPPRIMQQVDSGQLPLHMALLQYMNFLRGRGLS